ncbi:MAG: hypothetical protein U9R75_05595 [Candidatus Thermoplasmatota archaeon]|nr:hypothetical protein [Candidatus Thermoplasmatota archaeon]
MLSVLGLFFFSGIALAGESEVESSGYRTIISDDILVDTEWNFKGSPYIILDHVQLGSGVELRIGPGTEVLFEVNGTLSSGMKLFESGGYLIDHQDESSDIVISGNVTDPVVFGMSGGPPSSRITLGIGTGCELKMENASWNGSGSILLLGSDNCTIKRSVFGNGSGIILEDVPDGEVWKEPQNNVIRENVFYAGGRSITISSGSLPENNLICMNDLHLGTQVNGKGGSWMDQRSIGNYWENYNGSDLDGDGIGDTDLPWMGMDEAPLMDPYLSSSLFRDTDGDNATDLEDDDDDGDGWTDEIEIGCGTDHLDSSMFPDDNDGDLVPDDLDEDDDNDGFSDILEVDHGSEPLDNTSFPKPPKWKVFPGFRWMEGFTIVIELFDLVIDMDTPIGSLEFSVTSSSDESVSFSISNGTMIISSWEKEHCWFVVNVSDGVFNEEAFLEIFDDPGSDPAGEEENNSALEFSNDFIDFIFEHLPEIMILGISLMLIQGIYTMVTRRRDR